MWLYFLVVAAAAGLWAFWQWSRARKRREVLASRLNDAAREIVARHVPLSRKLPEELRPGFEGRINLFLRQVEFVGCDGLEVTREMELSIAAQACLIVVNSDAWYDELAMVLIYPGAFKSRQAEHDGFVVTEREIVRIGESWGRGQVVLSWQHVEEGGADPEDGHNVVLHEFAHQLDDLSGATDGAPLLARGQSGEDWARVFDEALSQHVHATERGRRGVFDPYGAEGPEEFFAVAVEAFFERPRALRHEAPEVYAQLALLLEVDPARW